jgi:hypothetical protein
VREIRTPGSTGREPETGLWQRLHGHEAGNGGHSQVRAYGYRVGSRPYRASILVSGLKAQLGRGSSNSHSQTTSRTPRPRLEITVKTADEFRVPHWWLDAPR